MQQVMEDKKRTNSFSEKSKLRQTIPRLYRLSGKDVEEISEELESWGELRPRKKMF
jgi:hypothetical protein